MVQWKHQLPLKDIWEWHESLDGGGHVPELGQRVASRLRAQYWFDLYPELEDIAASFEDCADIEEFDDVLADLYDWGDEGNCCWIATF